MAIAVAVLIAMLSIETSKQSVALTARAGLPPVPQRTVEEQTRTVTQATRRARAEGECDPRDLAALREVLKEIEGGEKRSQIRAAGWVLGAFPADHWLHNHARDLGRIRKQMTASQAPSDTYAFEIASMFASRGDLSSRMAELVLKTAWH